MINIDDTKLIAIRKYWKELCMIALVYTVIFLFQQLVNANNKIYNMQEEEISKKEEEAKFWRDAFIKISKYNEHLTQKTDSL